MTLERNEQLLRGDADHHPGEYTLFDDPMAQALVAFEADELDQAQVTGTDLERVKNDPNLGPLMKVFPRSGTAFVVCDTTNPPTDNVLVRQALSMAIIATPWPTGSSRASSRRRRRSCRPISRATTRMRRWARTWPRRKELLAEAGFPDGAGFPELTLTYNVAYRDQATAAKYLQGVWKQNLGINVTLDPLEAKEFQDWFNSRKDQPYNLMINAAGSDWRDPANWHNQLFDSQADFYHARWKNDEFDTLVREAAVWGIRKRGSRSTNRRKRCSTGTRRSFRSTT